MAWWLGVKRVNLPLVSYSSFKSESSALSILANLMNDVRHGTSPKSIQDLFEYVSSVHPYYTRSSHSHNLYIKHSRLSIHANSFSRIGARLCNEISSSLRNLSKDVFKRKIKQNLTNILNAEDSYIDVPEIILKMKSFSIQISSD